MNVKDAQKADRKSTMGQKEKKKKGYRSTNQGRAFCGGNIDGWTDEWMDGY